MRYCGLLLLVLIMASFDESSCAGEELSAFANRAARTRLDRQSPDRPYPEWRDRNAILGPPDGQTAKLVIHNGWNDSGSMVLDLGLEISRGELIITHRQDGPGSAKRTSVAAGVAPDALVPLEVIGEPQEMTTTRIRFEIPVRFVELHGYAGGGVETDSVWEFDAVELRFRADAVRSLARLRERVGLGREILSSLRPFARETFAEDIVRLTASLDRLDRDVREAAAALRRDGQAAVPDVAEVVTWQERRLTRVEQGVRRVQIHSLFGGESREMPQMILGWESSGRKVGPRSHVDSANLRPEGRVELARREYEAIQLLVLAGSEDLANVRVEVSSLARDGGTEVLREDNLWLGLVGTVNIGEPWPDPILPYEPFAVKADQVQPVWVRVHVPEGTPAGTYSGTVTVQADGAPTLTTRLGVRVRDFSLPVVGKMKTILGWPVGNLYRPIVLEHRHSPGGGPGVGAVMDARYFLTTEGHIRIDWTDYDEQMQQCFDQGLACFGIPWSGGDAGGMLPGRMHKAFVDEATGEGIDVSLSPLDGPTERAHCVEWLRQFAAHLRDKGWLERAIVYIWDEPKAEHCDTIVALGETVREADPDLRIMLVTKATNAPALFDVVDIFCPWVRDFHGEGLQEIRRIRAQGKELWWYNCGDPYPCPTYSIPHAGLIPRVMYWLNWKFGITGNLYWAFHVWGEDPYEHPGPNGKGDGMLFYPPLDGKPVISIRLEMIRDGIEDYEYLALLEERIEAAEAAGGDVGLLRQARALLEVPDEIAATATQYTTDPAVLEAQRARIADMIERLSST